LGFQVFEQLKSKTDPNAHQRNQDELNARNFAQHQKSQERLVELVGSSIRQALLKLFAKTFDRSTTTPLSR
jgi:hypothetical protein